MKTKSNRPARSLKDYLKILLKAGFVVGLLYYLSQKGFISLQHTKRAFSQWQFVLPAFLLLCTNLVIGTFRWQWLLQAQGIELRWFRMLQLGLIGNFFNVALPGAVSGDFVKAFYIAKEAPGKRARAFGSILFDRVAGLSALVLLATGALITGLETFKGTALVAAIQSFLIIAASCVVIFYSYLFLVTEKHDPVMKLLRKIESKIPKAGSFVRIYESLRHYHNHRAVVAKALLVSLLIHSLVGVCFYNFGMALGETQLQLQAVYVVMSLGLLITTIPVAPAGVGTGHAAFLYLFHLIGSERGADIFTLFALMNFTLGAIGGLVYLRFRTTEPEPVLEVA